MNSSTLAPCGPLWHLASFAPDNPPDLASDLNRTEHSAVTMYRPRIGLCYLNFTSYDRHECNWHVTISVRALLVDQCSTRTS